MSGKILLQPPQHAGWFCPSSARARVGGDGVDYDVLDGGRPDVKHETEVLTLDRLRITGVKLTGAELNGGDVYYTLAAA